MTDRGWIRRGGPASQIYISADSLSGLDLDQGSPVDYVAARDNGKDPAKIGSWHVFEDTTTMAGPRKKDPVRPGQELGGMQA